MPKQPLLTAAESERVWLMTELCDRYRRMIDELHAGIVGAGAYRGILREIDPTVEDALRYVENAMVLNMVLGLVRLSDSGMDSCSVARALPRLRSGSCGIGQPFLGEVESAIKAYLEAVEPFRAERDRMIAHADRRHPGTARFYVQQVDGTLQLLVRALQVIDVADGRSRRELARQGSGRGLGTLIGEAMVARARRPKGAD